MNKNISNLDFGDIKGYYESISGYTLTISSSGQCLIRNEKSIIYDDKISIYVDKNECYISFVDFGTAKISTFDDDGFCISFAEIICGIDSFHKFHSFRKIKY